MKFEAAAKRVRSTPVAIPIRPSMYTRSSVARLPAATQEVGELFEYAIKAPVSIPRQNSAMQPIVNQAVEAERVSIYNPATHAKFPLNGLQLTNSTNLHLMQGPATVFDGQVYAGDAKLTPALQKALERVVAMCVEVDGIVRKIQELDKQVNEAVQDQNRVRENVKTLQKDSDPYRRQVTKLNDLETQIETLREQIAELRKQEAQKRTALEEYLLSLNVE